MEGAELTLLEGSSGGSALRNPPAKAEDTGDAASIPGREDPLEEGTAAHSSVLAWRTTWILPWTEEPGRLQSIGSQRAGHD